MGCSRLADGGSFVVTKDVRDLCIFSPHSVIRDPPFSRIDLVSCRNLLIYFGPEIQNQVIPIFHYSLRPGRYLFLGTAENANQFPELFSPVDKRHRIFRSRDAAHAHADIAGRWFSWPNILLLSPVPVITGLVGWILWRSLARGQVAPFLLSVLLFSLSYLGIAISLFPMIVPHHFSLWDAASDPSTQLFLGLGTLFLLPIIAVYTSWSYWVFRGKVRDDIGYH
jgi:hypothetical protein